MLGLGLGLDYNTAEIGESASPVEIESPITVLFDGQCSCSSFSVSDS